MSKVRGIRFNKQEEALVEEFLQSNPLFDFTTLAKISILEFIKYPKITLKPVGAKQDKEKQNVRTN